MRKALISLTTLLVIAALVVGGIGWHFSGRILTTEREVLPKARVLNTDATTITFARSEYVNSPGRYGLRWTGGSALAGPIIRSDKSTITRELRDLKGIMPSGNITWDRNIWDGDPKSTIGIDYQDVSVRSDIGEFPAWLIPGSSTWVIVVHGRGGERDTVLRTLPALRKSGDSILTISYRNDVGSPQSPDGKDHLGDTEWRDVDAAITFARNQGAKNVVLYGWSKGGALVMNTLRHSPQQDLIRGAILDAPVVDWRETLEFQGEKRHLPEPVIEVAARMTEQRGNLDFGSLDQTNYAPSLHVPVLLFHGENDESVPVRLSKTFAAKNSTMIELELFPGAMHNASWNADPDRYEAELATFLGRLA